MGVSNPPGIAAAWHQSWNEHNDQLSSKCESETRDVKSDWERKELKWYVWHHTERFRGTDLNFVLYGVTGGECPEHPAAKMGSITCQRVWFSMFHVFPAPRYQRRRVLSRDDGYGDDHVRCNRR